MGSLRETVSVRTSISTQRTPSAHTPRRSHHHVPAGHSPTTRPFRGPGAAADHMKTSLITAGPCHIGDMWGHVRCDRTVAGAPGLVVFGRADATPPMMTVSKTGIVSRSRARVPIFPYPDALSGGVSRSGW